MSLSKDVKFWEEWERGGDLERLAKTRELVNTTLARYYLRKRSVYAVTSLLNAYFEDLKHYLEEEKKNEK